MADYIVGDVHGCIDELQRLLDTAAFEPGRDKLWCVGDLVGRGPHSKQVLQFVAGLGDAFGCVLGNHDLHLISVLHGIKPAKPSDNTEAILTSSEREFWIDWLRHQPIMVTLAPHQMALSHAGLYPQWSPTEAQRYADEASNILRGEDYLEYLREMYHNLPSQWSEQLAGYERFRFIINAFTRMRYCFRDQDHNLHLDLTCKLPPQQASGSIQPWFNFLPSMPITWVFGHWAALQGNTQRPDVLGLDTGCVWGESLTMIRCHDRKMFQQAALPR